MDPLCRNCNQFYGSIDGLCSSCAKASQTHKPNPTPQTAVAPPPVVNVIAETKPQQEEAKERPTQCHFCHRRLGPVHFSCKCEGMYCNKHRLPEQHDCLFDHQAVGKRKLSESNPQVVADKLNKL